MTLEDKMGVLVGKKAPYVKSKAVVDGQIIGDFSLESYRGNYVVLFFYPLDFTFVCPTELHAFEDRISEFQKRGVCLVGCSVDSCFSHLAWLKTPKVEGGIKGISYPLIADINKEFCTAYDVLKEDDGIAYRGLFLIDKQGIVRYQVVNDLPLGRSVDETLRMIDALIFHEENGEVCPANWRSGDLSMKATSAGLSEYFVKITDVVRHK